MARFEKVLDEALKLEPDAPSQQRPDADWINEVERRARAAVQGAAGVPWAEAKTRVQTPPTGR